MPIYEYLCESCGKVNERLQKVGDRPPRTCDECGGKKLAKLVSRSAFQLKGGGWYSDLYASARKKDGGKAAGEGTAAAGSTAPASGAAAATGAPAANDSAASPAKAKPAPSAPSAPATTTGKAGKKAG